MKQQKRSQYRTFINTATTTGESYENAKWTLEGEGVEELAIDFNPNTDTFKPIIRDTSDITFNNYEMSSSVSDKRCYDDEPMYEYLKPLAKEAKVAYTQAILVDTTAKGSTDGSYEATLYDVLITIDSWLGENATISYNINYTSEPVQGNVTIADGAVSAFTPTI